jgi:D-glycero-D-manno-heptose 1,7-bisphosphate phosphatase
MYRAVFLDRDGVLNRSVLVDGVPTPPSRPEDVEILDGVVQAIQILKAHSFIPVVVTNQPDVARGHASRSQVEAINKHISSAIEVEYFYTCFHDDIHQCNCRKPFPGLLLRAAEDLRLDTYQSYMVGDRWRDIAAGQAVGCQSFFIDYSYSEREPRMPFRRVSSLLQATSMIIGEINGRKAGFLES